MNQRQPDKTTMQGGSTIQNEVVRELRLIPESGGRFVLWIEFTGEKTTSVIFNQGDEAAWVAQQLRRFADGISREGA